MSAAKGSGRTAEIPRSRSLGELAARNDKAVKAAASVTFDLKNEGVAIHNMRIAGPDGSYNTDDDAVSDPQLVNAGEAATLAWTAPAQPGEMKFQCDFHVSVGMVGTITVE